MKRRTFIAGLGSVAAWPAMGLAQQRARMRRIGVLLNVGADDPYTSVRLGAFEQGLQQLNWTVGDNLQIDYRFGMGDPNLFRKYATELVALAPDVILAQGGSTVGPLLQVTREVPIVFVGGVDPVGSGYAASLARPGGNVTGFSLFEYGLSGKWLDLLKQIAPRMTRVAVIWNSSSPGGVGQLDEIQSVAQSFGMEITQIGLQDTGEIERDVATFGRGPNGGLIVTQSPSTTFHRDLIITLAARHKLPAVYPFRYYVASGGLISYGADPFMQYRLAGTYIDRILKGEKPADLPVQAPTKFELVINVKTAKALGLTIPETLLATADEVIQ